MIWEHQAQRVNPSVSRRSKLRKLRVKANRIARDEAQRTGRNLLESLTTGWRQLWVRWNKQKGHRVS